MNRHVRSGFLLLPLLLTACQSQEVELAEPALPEEVFYASLEMAADDDTKTYMDADAVTYWNADDCISIFAGTTQNRRFRFLGTDGERKGEFAAVDAADGSSAALTANYAAHPYQENTGISEAGIISLTLPAEQSYRAGSFDPAAQLMVAWSESRQFAFRNLGCLLGFQLKGDAVAVRTITLRGNADEVLAGRLLVSQEDGLSASFAEQGRSATLTLTAATPVVLNADTPTRFWMVLPPMTFEQGFTLTVTDADGKVCVKKLSRSLTLVRNTAGSMAPITVVPVDTDAPTAFGIYPDYHKGGTPMAYDIATMQMSVFEAEGMIYSRVLQPSTLQMYEIGPVPADVAVGDSVELTLRLSVSGTPVSSQAYTATVLSLSGGVLTLVSGDTYFIVRI